ncbi:MAG: transcriptional regulator [Flavobacteriaceae bacterium]|nr:transcriptional regulator [Flavobacteriaceae bacterium]|tara:strand:+ start:4318 stop:5478 length:1161 start_codon:yes stop_codon:yes gene_type:complete
MKKIQMVDLGGQYQKIKSEVNDSITEILESSAFINGPAVKEFQINLENYLGVKHVIPCANGTDALQIAMMGLGLKPGDEVITADFTFASTVEVIALLGLTPVLVDVCPNLFTINVDIIEKAITPNTKAIVPVHLFGHCANMEVIMQIASKHNLFVIEDCAQSMGADYVFSNGRAVKSGNMGHVSATSFFPSKNLGCYGDGGAIFTNDDDLAHTIRGIVNHGMYKRYHHDVVGVNSRLDSIQAAVLNAKLPLLDAYNAARQLAAKKYTEKLRGLDALILPAIRCNKKNTSTSCNCHVFHQYTIRLVDGNRDELVAHLNSNGVPCGVYYPIPLHQQKAYSNDRYNEVDFTITNQLSKQVFSLPMHTELEDEQIEYIVDTIKGYLARVS